jgi:hypothetical protein
MATSGLTESLTTLELDEDHAHCQSKAGAKTCFVALLIEFKH